MMQEFQVMMQQVQFVFDMDDPFLKEVQTVLQNLQVIMEQGQYVLETTIGVIQT